MVRVVHLQFSNGFVRPVRMFLFVQLRFWESVVQVFDGHLVEGNHVLEFVQLGEEGKRIRTKEDFDEVFPVEIR